MDYSENKEQIIKDNLKWADKAIIEEFLSTDAYKVWISGFSPNAICDSIEEWIASGVRLWRDGFL
ncbi:MAG: hypothetical protein J5527_02985 [Treponema sp.]|nr:hypothetical protein [Treponema sp.]